VELDRTVPTQVAEEAAVVAASRRLAATGGPPRPPSPTAPPPVDPTGPTGAPSAGDDLDALGAREQLTGALGALRAAVEAAGGEEVVVVARPDAPVVAAAAEDAGFLPCREVVQLRRPLPLPDDLRAGPLAHPARARLRSFRPGVDDAAWLAVNHRAFAWHPDQGDWGPPDLAERLASPWFDAEGFLVLDGDDGRLDGFCWTKVHPATATDPALGEIFVIGVDPDAHGRGLGRALVVAGLDHLAARGLGTAMLYTEADNEPALALYRSLGFTRHHADRWYRRRRTG
jgi:mycothiol synthase